MKYSKLSVGTVVATVFGAGYIPIAPGTAGSLVSAGLFLVLQQTALINWVLCVCFLILGYWGCCAGRKKWGEDPSKIVVDEFAGCWIACLAVPSSWGTVGIAAAFILFRIFDIFKPWPVSVLDRMKSASGILLDDVAAGIMAALVILLGSVIHGAL
ncbi:MAG: phosphatidylglycerophosphatase A [Candidatus Aegiribacteria sp.]|nr:phosphatidylglycerophosphatase A [Candidatus Aegiribacteria sp.]